jgi:amidase
VSGPAAPGGIFLARRGRVGGGRRLAVKDLFDTAGLVTTYGSRIFAEHRPASSADAVLRLESAGYAVVGKTNLDEFAYGVSGHNPWFGTVPNPGAPGRMTGGSSGGSAAALAAGLAVAALGSDSGGSIRIPAACCGVVGLKPTFGRVSLAGCFPLAPTFDTAGPMARTVAECARMMRALDPVLEPRDDGLESVTVGLAWLERAEPPVRAAVERAARRLPRTRPVPFPHPGAETPWVTTFRHEVAETHRTLFAKRAEEYSPSLRRKLEGALAVSDDEAEAGRRERARYVDRCVEAMGGVDLLLTPTLPCLPPAVGTRSAAGLRTGDALTSLVFPFNGLGWPALALPCPAGPGEPPASLQLVGRAGEDARLLAVAAALEAALA